MQGYPTFFGKPGWAACGGNITSGSSAGVSQTFPEEALQEGAADSIIRAHSFERVRMVRSAPKPANLAHPCRVWKTTDIFAASLF